MSRQRTFTAALVLGVTVMLAGCATPQRAGPPLDVRSDSESDRDSAMLITVMDLDREAPGSRPEASTENTSAVRIWRPNQTDVQGVVVAWHSFRDHRGAYDQIGPILAAAGWWVEAPDLPGHGAHVGPFGRLPANVDRVVEDATASVRDAVARASAFQASSTRARSELGTAPRGRATNHRSPAATLTGSTADPVPPPASSVTRSLIDAEINSGRAQQSVTSHQSLATSVESASASEKVPLPVILLGESLGGSIALIVAANHAETMNIRGVATAGAGLRGGIRARRAWDVGLWLLERLAPAVSVAVNPDYSTILSSRAVQRFAEDPAILRRVRLDTYIRVVWLAQAATDIVDKVDIPVLYYWGGQDRTVLKSSICAAAAAHPKPARVRVITRSEWPHLTFQSRDFESISATLLRWMSDPLRLEQTLADRPRDGETPTLRQQTQPIAPDGSRLDFLPQATYDVECSETR